MKDINQRIPGRRCPECEVPEFKPTRHDVLLAEIRQRREASGEGIGRTGAREGPPADGLATATTYGRDQRPSVKLRDIARQARLSE